MPGRIPCANPVCSNTILPDTALRNNGFCMPCVQAVAKQARDEHIRQNRSDLDEFTGVTDPVEVLQIVHRPRKFDPLIRRIPHPTPIDQLYLALNPRDGRRLAECAASLVGTDHHGEAEKVILCLAAFTEINLDVCLRSLASRGFYRPSFPFHRAPADVRDHLLARVEAGTGNRNHLLLALAWIGDAAVVERFAHWRRKPPSWGQSLFVPPWDYSREAGWELTAEGRRRNLYFAQCVELVPGHSARPASFMAIQERKDACPWCQTKLTNLFDVDGAIFHLVSGSVGLGIVQVATCEVCTAFGTVFGQLDDKGRGRWRWAPKNSRPKYLPDDTPIWDRLPEDALTLGKPRSPFVAADQFVPAAFSQLGGHPTWIQDADYSCCLECGQTMMFLAQVDHGDIETAEGIYYAFVCQACQTTATTYQQT